MSERRSENALYYNEIDSIEPDFIYLTGHLYIDEDTDEEFTRMMRVQGDEWKHVFDLDEIAWSVCAFLDSADQRNCFLMGRNGSIKAYEGTSLKESQISMAPGKMFEICHIGESTFACGSLHQVFFLSKSGWKIHDKKLAKNRDDGGNEAFFGIHGLKEDDFYCVGRFGAIAHFNGKAYSFLDIPTNVHLERVYCKSKKEIYVCGRDGVLFKGDGKGAWEDINDAGCEAHFWGLTEFQGQIYACTDSEIYVYDGNNLTLIDVGLEEPLSYYRLAATSKYLWATSGRDDVFRFDGSNWERMISSEG